MKRVRAVLLAVMFAVGIGVAPVANADSQLWEECCVGSFNAFGIKWVSGSTFANPALSSAAAGWTEVGNATNAFATFNTTTFMDFYVNLAGPEGTFIIWAWNDDDVLVDSVLASLHSVITYPYPANAPSRAEQFILSGGHVPSVPEPGTFALLAIGLVGLGFSRKKRNSGIAAA
jgi:hypothetical protein